MSSSALFSGLAPSLCATSAPERPFLQRVRPKFDLPRMDVDVYVSLQLFSSRYKTGLGRLPWLTIGRPSQSFTRGCPALLYLLWVHRFTRWSSFSWASFAVLSEPVTFFPGVCDPQFHTYFSLYPSVFLLLSTCSLVSRNSLFSACR